MKEFSRLYPLKVRSGGLRILFLLLTVDWQGALEQEFQVLLEPSLEEMLVKRIRGSLLQIRFQELFISGPDEFLQFLISRLSGGLGTDEITFFVDGLDLLVQLWVQDLGDDLSDEED